MNEQENKIREGSTDACTGGALSTRVYGIGLGVPTKVKHLREITPISFSGCCFMRIYLTRFRA